MSTPDRTGARSGRRARSPLWLASVFCLWLGLKLLDPSEIGFAYLAWRALLVCAVSAGFSSVYLVKAIIMVDYKQTEC